MVRRKKLTAKDVLKSRQYVEPTEVNEETVQPNVLFAYEKLFLITGIQTPESEPRRHNKLVRFKLARAILYHLMGSMVCYNFIWSFSKTSPSVHSFVDALAKCLLPPTLWWIMYSNTHALRDANQILFDNIEYHTIHNIDIKPWKFLIPFLISIPFVVFGGCAIDSGSKNLLISENFVPDVLAPFWVYIAEWPAYVVFQGIYIITGLYYIVQCMCRSSCVSKLNRMWHVINPIPHEYFDVCQKLLETLESHMSVAITFVIVHCWIEFMNMLDLATDLLVGRPAVISVITCFQVIVLYTGIVLSADHLEQTLSEFYMDMQVLLGKSKYKEKVVERERILTASGLVLEVKLLKVTLLLAVSFGVMLYIKKDPSNILMDTLQNLLIKCG